MRLGLLADIHEANGPLAGAVRELTARRVDAFVMLGDVLDNGERVDETVALLAPLPGVAVWGNHDFGLCGELDRSVRDLFSTPVVNYFSHLRPWAELGGCRFQHIDPHLDPEALDDLWRFTTAEERIAGLAQCSYARVFVGHLHGWALFTPEREIAWSGESTFRFQGGQRYLTVVNAVVNGWCALLDTERDELEPIRVA
jgi:hypothetical protein